MVGGHGKSDKGVHTNLSKQLIINPCYDVDGEEEKKDTGDEDTDDDSVELKKCKLLDAM